MIYLIVPPIIIILAIATLIVFLTRILASNNSSSISFVNTTKNSQSTLKKSKEFIKDKSVRTSSKIKKSIQNSASAVKPKRRKYNGDSIMTQGIISDENVDNVVTLKKKSMVSERIEVGDVQDEEELKLMKEIEKDPQNSLRYEKLGDYYMEQEKFEDARDCYKYVLRLDPKHKKAQVAMRNLDRVL
jgi:tetratricopeptide (TPR) repeat protein